MSPAISSFIVLVRRYPHSAICALITLILGSASWFLWVQDAELETVHRDRSKEGEAMLQVRVGGSTQRQELDAVREATRRIADNLVIETDLAENAWYFYRIEEQTKVRLSELHPISAPTTDASSLFKRIPYTIRVSGTYEQTAAFLLALETGERLVNITSFTFSRAANGMALDLNIEVLGKK